MSNILSHIKFPNDEHEREVVDKAGREVIAANALETANQFDAVHDAMRSDKIELQTMMHNADKVLGQAIDDIQDWRVRTNLRLNEDESRIGGAETRIGANETNIQSVSDAVGGVDERLATLENDTTGNLLEGVGVTNNTYIDDSGVERFANFFFTTDYIPVKGGAAVHLAGTIGTVTSSHRRLHAYNASRGWIEQTIDINVAGTPSYDDTAVLPLNAAFVRFCYRSGDTAMSLTTSVLVDKGARIELANHEGRIKTLENGGGGGTGLVLDPTLTDLPKAAPADIVGAIKDDYAQQIELLKAVRDALRGGDVPTAVGLLDTYLLDKEVLA